MRSHTAVLFVLDYFKKGRCQRPLYKRSIQRSLSHQSLHLPIGIPFLPQNLHMYFQKKPNLTYYLYKSYLCVVQRRRWPYSHLQEPRRFPNQTCNYLAYGYGQYLISQNDGYSLQTPAMNGAWQTPNAYSSESGIQDEAITAIPSATE